MAAFRAYETVAPPQSVKIVATLLLSQKVCYKFFECHWILFHSDIIAEIFTLVNYISRNEEVLQMSVENLKKYGKMCEENEDVRKRAKEIGLQDMDGQIACAKSLGLDISREDFAALAKEAGLDGTNELSEEDLEKVAGGVATTTVAAVVVALGVGSAVVSTMPGW
jgi:predicted ribosomally synthesized peptide with nif11-like leader